MVVLGRAGQAPPLTEGKKEKMKTPVKTRFVRIKLLFSYCVTQDGSVAGFYGKRVEIWAV